MPQDPNFLKISIACGKIEQFIESIFPSENVKEIVAKGELQRKVGLGASPPKDESTIAETTWDMFYIFLAISAVLFVVLGSMVGLCSNLKHHVLTNLSSSV